MSTHFRRAKYCIYSLFSLYFHPNLKYKMIRSIKLFQSEYGISTVYIERDVGDLSKRLLNLQKRLFTELIEFFASPANHFMFRKQRMVRYIWYETLICSIDHQTALHL